MTTTAMTVIRREMLCLTLIAASCGVTVGAGVGLIIVGVYRRVTGPAR